MDKKCLLCFICQEHKEQMNLLTKTEIVVSRLHNRHSQDEIFRSGRKISQYRKPNGRFLDENSFQM